MTWPPADPLETYLDADGILRPGSPVFPDGRQAYTVFSQEPHAFMDPSAIARHAQQFFGCRMGIARVKTYRWGYPKEDAAPWVFEHQGRSVLKWVLGQPTDGSDLDAALRAEASSGASGLGALARRCPQVFRIPVDGPSDGPALAMAGIVASVVLGPILSPGGDELFGVRTARQRWQSHGGP